MPGLERCQECGAYVVGLPVEVGALRHQGVDGLLDAGRLDLGVACVAEHVSQPAELVADGFGHGAIEKRAARREGRA